MKHINKLFIISILFVMPNAQASLITSVPSNLLDGVLSEQSIYANLGVTLGVNTKVGGNVQGASAITTGVNSVIGGSTEAGTSVTTGAGSIIGGNVKAGTTVNTGVGSVVEGSVISGTTTGTGGTSTVNGDIEAGGIYSEGIGATTNGTVTDMLASDPTYVAPTVENQSSQIGDVQETLRLLGVGNSTDLDITFGTVSETLTTGIYDSLDYLTIRAGMTLTLDGEGVDGDFIFNIHNYLNFAADASVELINFTDDSQVIWNVLGDNTGTAGYFEAAAGADIIGFVFARGYVGTGAYTTISGVGDSCGGAFSSESYAGFGANNTIGSDGCVSSFANVSEVPEPGAILLLAFGFMGLVLAKKKKV